ncbi:MAG: FAD binding domain-containing protein [Phycisphaerales bacterium]
MNRFSIIQATHVDEAVAAMAPTGGAVSLPLLKGGGMDLLDQMKEGILEPTSLVNLRTMKDPAWRTITDGRIGALATLAEVAGNAAIRKAAPVLAKAVAGAATPQVRNVATVAGNLLQRPRCWYFRQHQFECLKKGGSTCFAVEGENRYHAIFGRGPCHIVHPSNLAPALWVCAGGVELAGGTRNALAIADLFHAPDKGILGEHNLEPNEVVTAITFRPAPVSGFYAVKEKQSFDWPLVFACVALELDGRTIASARVCAGAVAPTPWPLPRVAEALRGVNVDDESALAKACAGAADGAAPMTDNAYKVRLLPVAVKRAVRDAVAG